jgi:predicted amidophosphoribosyltransferase
MLPPEVYAWLNQNREQGYLLPPLEPPASCERCQRPMDPEGEYRTCYPCEFHHGPALSRFAAATYGADGTPPWRLLLEAKFESVPAEALADRVTFIAAAIWETVEAVAPNFLQRGPNYTIAVPSSHNLLVRCANDANARGWPSLGFVEGLRAEDRPRQTGQSGDARRASARGKYTFHGDLTDANVLLLDDVYTSGYSIHDAARAAQAAGAASVTAVVYARRVYPEAMALYREVRGV